MTLEQHYRDTLERASDIQGHLQMFVDTVAELDATKVIELGTRGGCSTVAWLYGLEGRGHLWSVDLDPAPAFDYPHWTFIEGNDLSERVLEQLPDQVDVVFIDTSHAYDHTLDELAAYVPRVRPGGRVLLHDTELEQPEGIGPSIPFPVKRAVEAYCGRHGLSWKNYEHCFGLGVVEV